jgi:hypothetical protein
MDTYRSDISGRKWDVVEGTMVVDADGVDLGTVIQTRPGFLVVEKGRIFPSDLYIPRAAVAAYDGHLARLAVAKEEIEARGWTHEPDTEPFGDEVVTLDFDPETAAAGGPGNQTPADRGQTG